MTVRADGTLLLNSDPIDSASLKARLERLYRNASNRAIFVRGEKSLAFSRVAEVIDLARGAGAFRIALMTN